MSDYWIAFSTLLIIAGAVILVGIIGGLTVKKMVGGKL